jgi:hypothetical protein
MHYLMLQMCFLIQRVHTYNITREHRKIQSGLMLKILNTGMHREHKELMCYTVSIIYRNKYCRYCR